MKSSKELYSNILNSTASILENDLLRENDFESIATILKKSKRIFFTASGSSIPAAKHCSDMLRSQAKYASFFVGTSELLSTTSIDSNDCIVLVSQGFNRSDGLIVTHFAQEITKAKFILVTANTSDDINCDGKLLFSPPAEKERIFCRPAGVITSFALLTKLAHTALGLPFSNQKCIDAVTTGSVEQDLASDIHSAEIIIVLASGSLLPAAANIALALREGLGKVSNFFEIEYYAHGQYAPHTKRFSEGAGVHYMLMSTSVDSISEKAVARILPFLTTVGLPYTHWEESLETPYASIKLLRQGGLLVEKVLSLSGYDMNNPLGKEENRGFQLVSANFYQQG